MISSLRRDRTRPAHRGVPSGPWRRPHADRLPVGSLRFSQRHAARQTGDRCRGVLHTPGQASPPRRCVLIGRVGVFTASPHHLDVCHSSGSTFATGVCNTPLHIRCASHQISLVPAQMRSRSGCISSTPGGRHGPEGTPRWTGRVLSLRSDVTPTSRHPTAPAPGHPSPHGRGAGGEVPS